MMALDSKSLSPKEKKNPIILQPKKTKERERKEKSNSTPIRKSLDVREKRKTG